MRIPVRPSIFLAITLIAPLASAQTLRSAENWENAAPETSYKCTTALNTFQNNVCSAAAIPLIDSTLNPEINGCGGKYTHETTQASGGRVFQGKPLAIVAGTTYCASSYVRTGVGQNFGFIGINLTNAQGVPTPPGVAPGASDNALSEHWLIGSTGFVDSGNPSYGAVSTYPNDGKWYWRTKSFVAPVGATNLILKYETFCGDNSCGQTNAQIPNTGTADFDDLRLYEGLCPLAPLPEESDHGLCGVGSLDVKPFCVSRNVTVLNVATKAFSCTSCASNFGGALAPSCLQATPICVKGGAKQGACTSTCDGDNGANTNAACPSATNPTCLPGGTCGLCKSNLDCAGDPGSSCDIPSGKCIKGCKNPSEALDCKPTEYCNAIDDLSVGACTPKKANGEDIPTAAPFGGLCTVAKGVRACTSGVCNAQDNKCGQRNSDPCAAPADCRSNVCNADGKCGNPNGDPCTVVAECRSAICPADGKCGKDDGQPCAASTECRTAICNGNNTCGTIPGGCTIATEKNDCGTSAYCNAKDNASRGACVPKIANGGSIPTPAPFNAICTDSAGARACVAGTCNVSDNKCGHLAGEACTATTQCRTTNCDVALSVCEGTKPTGVIDPAVANGSLEGGGIGCSTTQTQDASPTALLGLAAFAAMFVGRRRKHN